MKFFVNVSLAFAKAKGSFLDINPTIPSAFNGKTKIVVRTAFTALYYKGMISRAAGTYPSQITGAIIAGAVINKIYRQPMKQIIQKGYALNTRQPIKVIPLNESHLMDKKKTWFDKPGKIKVKIIYHEGNKRGAHIDMHFSNGTSFVIDVRNKPIADQIKTNNKGMLTQKSIGVLMDHIRSEFDGNGNGSRVFQNYDHNPSEAAMEWFGEEQSPNGYGSGPIRQVIHESECNIMWHNSDTAGQATSIYMPGISPDRYVYFHQLYKNVDVAKMGFKAFKDVNFEDRLNLKMVDEKRFNELVDPNANTFKYDGASSYIEVSKHGTRFFSPRISSTTGHRIEYTGKMPVDVINTTSDIKYKGMGELLFKRDGKYLSSTDIGGLLNSNSTIPDDIETEYRLYRIDSINRQDVRGLNFFENRSIAETVTNMFNSTIKLPQFMTVEEAKAAGIEGIVGIAPGGNVFNGFKVKFKDNFFDWKIDKVKLKTGPKGNMAGVVECVSLESGKRFNLGPGQLGNHELVGDIMNNPDKYLGKVLRVSGFRGHEGRAAKAVDFHLDKGNG